MGYATTKKDDMDDANLANMVDEGMRNSKGPRLP
jgi:hypothetical protein